jgi:hypothetical protein
MVEALGGRGKRRRNIVQKHGGAGLSFERSNTFKRSELFSNATHSQTRCSNASSLGVQTLFKRCSNAVQTLFKRRSSFFRNLKAKIAFSALQNFPNPREMEDGVTHCL